MHTVYTSHVTFASIIFPSVFLDFEVMRISRNKVVTNLANKTLELSQTTQDRLLRR
ncbi:hypothetical protein WN55_08701 [Dufourea novaeangliae]|uniref:Uncharacterized protein n=1 Tax=Dufourea novaeangliae TaxID=178035 RepID=A0A154P173_DUFNO|nr:hypothetical protein WN55_08701 [Dufourea novaeangliae]